MLAGALEFLEVLACTVNQLDRFAIDVLMSQIREMNQWLARTGGEVSFDALDWLTQLPGEARVLGSGPRPGCIHVAHLLAGGHSGRRNTVILGLDDSRFPGAGLPDSLLLDGERRQLSPHLATAAARLEQHVDDFARLVVRLRGRLTLSFCCRSVDDDREMFPSGPVVAAYRLIWGQRDGDASDLAAWLARQSPPASFAPHLPAECVSAADWWLWRLCGATPVCEPESLVLAHYPHLARGLHATRERRKNEFTPYGGRVEMAEPDLDPTLAEHRVLSANRLQKIGKCPLMYFFEYGLGIAPTDELAVSPTVWLDALAAGSLLHG